MAYVQGPQSSRPAHNREQDENWKSDGFLNIRFRRPDGSTYRFGKTGSIPLSLSRKMDRALIEKIKAGDKEEILRQLLSVIELDVVLMDEESEAGDLGF